MTPLELLYFLGYSAKKRHALKNRRRLPHRVISIGNITLGGTGKTPAVMALAENAASRGFHPCILTRGYKGTARGPCFVSRGEGPLMSAFEAGDEPVLMAETLHGIPIVKGKDRHEAGMFAIAKLGYQDSTVEPHLLFILDDGFQHWALHRDKDILLIDGTNPSGNGRLFPMGSLREPFSEIKRADLIVITNLSPSSRSGGEGEEDHQQADERSLTEKIRKCAASTPVYFARHTPTAFRTASGNVVPLSQMKDKRVFAFCGIGNPYSFQHTLRSVIGCQTGFMVFKDHYRYSLADFRTITSNAEKCGADWIVTTEKDIMRLKQFSLPDNLLALRIEFRADAGFYEAAFDWRR